MKIKKIIMLCAVLVVTLCSLTSLSAQTRRDERRVPEDQIPIAIRNSFQQEFSLDDQTKKGFWSIYFEQQDVNSRKVLTPLAYIYHAKRQGEKIEIRYDAVGKLESAKGLTKKDTQTSGTH